MNTEQGVCAALLAAVLLAGCGGAKPVVMADPVIAGKRYVDAPVSLGRVKMMLKIREGDAAADPARAPESLELSLGFLGVNDSARVVLSSATLGYGKEGKVAEAVTRHQELGTAQGCPLERASVLPMDYWFNATVTPEFWTCVTIGFVTTGRMATDVLELRLDSLNVSGEVVRALPVTFVVRAPAE